MGTNAGSTQPDLVVGDPDCKFTRILSIVSLSAVFALLREKLPEIGNTLGISTADYAIQLNVGLIQPIEVLSNVLVKWRAKAKRPEEATLRTFIGALRDASLNDMATDLEVGFGL